MGLAALLAAAPAYAQDQPAAPAPDIAPADLTAFVQARAAEADGRPRDALPGYALALADVPDDAVVAVRAYREALVAGDIALASKAADALVRADAAPPDVAIFRFAVALKAKDGPGIDAALGRMAGGPLEFMVPVLKAWLAFDRGGDPLAQLDMQATSALAQRYDAEHRALLLVAMRRFEDAKGWLTPMLAGAGPAGDDLRIDAALLFAAEGERGEAQQLLAGASTDLSPLAARIGSGTRPSAAFGAARLFLSLAAELARADTAPLSILLTRTALLLDPGDDRARLYLAEALSRSGSGAEALAVLGEVAADSPYARGAAAGRVAALQRAGRTDEALALGRQLAESRDATSGDAQTYGDLLDAAGRFDEAAAAYGVAIARAGGEGGWQLHFLQGDALDHAGRWREAEPALRRAVALGPQEAVALNALALAEVAHHEKLDEAQALLERANALRPDDAAISDSLAWTYYLRGDVDRALPLLEKAAQADPGGSQVNEHLGDVYWRLGRHFEARYAWRAAAVYADGSDAARIAAKLANGLTGPSGQN